MAKKQAGENSKKAAGNAKKAEAAASKAAAADAKAAAAEDAQWAQGAKGKGKKAQADEEKAAEKARKAAEKKALEAEEAASLPDRPGPKNAKTAVKKTRGLDLSQLDDDKPSALNATGIDNALDALSLTGGASGGAKIDRHPERRYKAALAAFKARVEPEMAASGDFKGLRKYQRDDLLKKKFDASDENPFNQANAAHNATSEEVAQIKAQEKAKIEKNLS